VLRKLFVFSFTVLLLSALALAQSSQPSGSNDQSPSSNSSDDQSPPPNSKEAKDDAAFHNLSGINDVNEIGHRNVGCNRGLGNWYSLDSQVNMGRQFAQQVEASNHLIKDPIVTEYINRLGQNLARNSDSHLPFTIKVLDLEDANAFTLPGGFMFVQAGAILLADDESELAGVMAHEIGHVAACHAAREVTRANLAQIAMIPLIIATGPWVGLGIEEVGGLAVPATFSKFSRTFEAQADYLGIQYAYKAGYDPTCMINFFEKLEALEKKRPGVIAKAYMDHPQTPDRIEKSQHEIGTILPPREEYIVDSSEFQQVKKRLALLMKHRQLNDHQEDNPQLRRTGNDGSQGQPGSDSDDRPVIKRNPGSN
jgi:beta-barrel assembly-enhancing protease